MYSGEYDVGDVTLSVYPHRASLKNIFQVGHIFKLALCGYTVRVTRLVKRYLTIISAFYPKG